MIERVDTAIISDERKKTNQFLGSNLQVANLVVHATALNRHGVCWSSRPNQHFRAKEFTEPHREIRGSIAYNLIA